MPVRGLLPLLAALLPQLYSTVPPARYVTIGV